MSLGTSEDVGNTVAFLCSPEASFITGVILPVDGGLSIQLQENIDVLRVLSVSRLSLINSLVDYRLSGGISVRFGARALDFNVSSWRTELDQGQVNSYGIGLIMPVADFSDLELRFAYDDSENFGSTYVFSVFFYTFGN